MAEYIERQKVFDSLPTVVEDKTITLYGAVADFMVLVSTIPAADVVEVVRCKDCKYSAWRKSPFGVRTFSCQLLCADIKPEDFCSYGERKDGE